MGAFCRAGSAEFNVNVDEDADVREAAEANEKDDTEDMFEVLPDIILAELKPEEVEGRVEVGVVELDAGWLVFESFASDSLSNESVSVTVIELNKDIISLPKLSESK